METFKSEKYIVPNFVIGLRLRLMNYMNKYKYTTYSIHIYWTIKVLKCIHDYEEQNK